MMDIHKDVDHNREPSSASAS
ncbi:MAG: hypothetical protein JWO04_5999, partial [Gammaproteobacteria bacterium]|nr:hypothetical protein [Gammaproteobacteria bacterium]